MEKASTMAMSAVLSNWLWDLVSEKNHFAIMDLVKNERKVIVCNNTIGSNKVNPTKKLPNKKNDSSKLLEEKKKKINPNKSTKVPTTDRIFALPLALVTKLLRLFLDIIAILWIFIW